VILICQDLTLCTALHRNRFYMVLFGLLLVGGNESERLPGGVTMWIFGYGSLMWDGWETERGCTRRMLADLLGYCRVFNKASVKNWGTKSAPCPTLNLAKVAGGVCRGVAFEFPDGLKEELLSYLSNREGKAFRLHEMPVRLESNSEVSALVPLYEGQNVIDGKTLEETAAMVKAASGSDGSCFSYIKGIAEKLTGLGISDPVVAEFWRKVNPDA